MQPPAPFDPAALSEAELLRTALLDPDFRRARSASAELACRPDANLTFALDQLAGALRHPDAATQRRAAQALAALGERAAPAADALIQASADPRWTVRESAVQALAALAPALEAARAALLQLCLHDKAAHVRAAAVAGLALPGSEAVAALRRGLEHPFPRVRCRALRALVRFTRDLPELIPLFERSLAESHARVRSTAAEVLGECGHAGLAAVPALLRRLRDRDRRVHAAATAALARLRPLLPAAAGVVLDRLAGPGSAEENLRAALGAEWQTASGLLDAAEAAWSRVAPGRGAEEVRAAARQREAVRLTARLWAEVLDRAKA
jgi:HEAT repeat protein